MVRQHNLRTIFLIIFILFGTFCIAQIKTQDLIHAGVLYDTNYLKGDTKLIFSISDKYRDIRMINPAIDTIIRSMSIKHVKSDLGWLKADYDDYFLIYAREEEENPWMLIFNKQTGKSVASGDVIEFDTVNNILYYADFSHPNVLNIFNFNESKFERYRTPTVPCLHWWYCIKILGITEKELTIEYRDRNNIKLTKKYVR